MPDDPVFMMGKYAARIPADRLYAENHLWLQAFEGRWRVGFTAYSVRLLQDVYFLSWSIDPQTAVRHKQEIGEIDGQILGRWEIGVADQRPRMRAAHQGHELPEEVPHRIGAVRPEYDLEEAVAQIRALGGPSTEIVVEGHTYDDAQDAAMKLAAETVRSRGIRKPWKGRLRITSIAPC